MACRLNQSRGIRVGRFHVSRLHRQELLFGGLPEGILQGLDEREEVYRRIIADIVEAVGSAAAVGGRRGGVPVGVRRGRLLQYPGDALHDIIDIGKVAAHLAMVEDLDGLAFEYSLRKEEVSHIRPSPGPVDRKEAEPGGRQPKEVAVGMGQQFVGFLGSRIEGDRVVDRVGGAEGHFAVHAVHAGAGGIDEVLNIVVAAGFQYIGKAEDVALHVGVGVFEAVAHPGLCGEVDDGVKVFFAEELVEAVLVFELELYEVEVGLCFAGNPFFVGDFMFIEAGGLEAPHFEADVVVVVDTVEAYYFVAVLGEAVGEVVADEACGAGN